MTPRLSRLLVLASIGLAVMVAGAHSEDRFAFMPDGGKALLVRLFGPGGKHQDRLGEMLSLKGEADDWLHRLAPLLPEGTGEQAAQTLAAYLAGNFPPDGAEALAADPHWPDRLPTDGKDLAVSHCVTCHSFTSHYLMQKRNARLWMLTFAMPFHRAIAMSPAEQRTFADYSAINMPLPRSAIPKDFED